jgi:hypothetical protein
MTTSERYQLKLQLQSKQKEKMQCLDEIQDDNININKES